MFITLGFAQENGSIVGTITDKDMNDEPLPFANVQIKGTAKGTTTDMDGLFQIQDVTPGTYTVVISFIGYKTLEVPDVKVEAGKVANLNASLSADSQMLEAVTVETTTKKDSQVALLIEQKKAVEIKTSIGAQELSRKGISDASQGVVAAAGITKVASRGIFIRGLDDRYNSLLVNELPVSVVDWEQKIVPLELFTSDILRNIDINKVYYPNLYGDFAGATIDIHTKDIPNSQVVEVSFGAGVNSNAFKSGNTFLIDKESSTEYFGFGGADAREIPAVFSENTISTNISLTPSESANLFESDYNYEEAGTPVSFDFGVVVGDKIDLKNSDARLGYYIGLSYSNDYNWQYGSDLQYGGSGTEVRGFSKDNSFEFSTTSNLLMSLLYQNPRTKLALNYLQPRTSSNNFQDAQGFTRDVDNKFARNNRYKNSVLHQIQFIGSSYLDESNTSGVRYLGTYGIGKFSQPDQKVWSYEDNNEDGIYTTEFSNADDLIYNRYFLSSDNYNIAGKLEYFRKMGEVSDENGDFFKHTVKVGADANIEEVDFFNRFLLVSRYTTTANAFIVNPDRPNDVIENGFASGDLRYTESVGAPKSYVGNNNIYAGYASYAYKPSQKFDVSAGTRVEYINREYTLQNSGILTQFNTIEIESGAKLLPFVNAKYSLSDKTNLRFAASKTYTRPKNVETAPFLRIDSKGDELVGNPNLVLSDNYNADLKFELFPNSGELVSLNAFAKHIENPIETIRVQQGGTSFRTTFVNTESAFLYGLELEVIKKLGNIFDNEALNNIYFGFNATYMQSNVTLDRSDANQVGLISDERSLQGASDFLFNADANYDFRLSDNWESTFTVTFNTFSERISALGSGTINDQYEQPFNDLTFIWKNKLNEHLSISFKASNILNDTSERIVDQLNVQSYTNYKRGTDFSVGVNYSF